MEKCSKAGTCREACRILAEQEEGAEPGQLLHDFTRPQELTLCRHLGFYSFLNSEQFFLFNMYLYNRYRCRSQGYFSPVLWIPIRIGSRFGLDPDSIVSLDPDSQSGSRSRRAKITYKNRKNFIF
jgi:hypothetical protein